jgi:hypothetical protein
MEGRIEELLVRGVNALEKLAVDPTVEISGAPPICPHCQTVNPKIAVRDNPGTGQMGDQVVHATCLHCNMTFFAMATGWVSFRDEGELIEATHEGRENGSS